MRWRKPPNLTLVSRTHVQAITSRSCENAENQGVQCAPANASGYSLDPSMPTFDWAHATYHSRYVAFVHYDLTDRGLHLLPGRPHLELALFNRYVRILLPPTHTWHGAVWQTVTRPPSTGRGFPLILVGGYLNAGPNYAVPGDLGSKVMGLALPFAAIQRSLGVAVRSGRRPPELVTDFNAEANLLTALICRADGKRPGKGCSRPAIKSILKHAR